MKTVFVFLGAALLLFLGALCAQTITLKGKVSDPKGESLAGVNVHIKNGLDGVVTDIDGNYSLGVSAGQTVVFSYVGFITQEHAVAGQTLLDVILKEDSQSLDDIVVKAIGIRQQKKKLGYTT
jgi:hypothetical protein